MRLAPGEPAPPAPATAGILRFWQATAPHRRDVWWGAALLPPMILLELAQPYLLKLAVDGDAATMGRMGVLLIAVVAASYVVTSVHTFLMQRAGHRTLSDLRADLFRHLMAQGTAFFDRRPVGALLSRVTSDSEAVGQSFTLGMVSMLADLLLVAGTLAVMFALDARVTAWLLLLAPPIVLVIRLFNRLLRRYADDIRRAVAQVNNVIEENLAGLRIVRLFGREAQSREEYEGLTSRYYRLYFRFNIADAMLYAIMESLAALTVGGILWFAAGPVLEGAMTLGLVVAFVEYAQRAFVPIKEMSGKLAGLQSAFAALARMDGTLSYAEDAPTGGEPWSPRQGAIRFEGVRFRYRDDGPDVLRDVDLAIAPGERVAIVGPTGSGKTTLLNLLTRHYAPTAGRILLDGHAIEAIDDRDFRAGVGIIRQDVFLFEGSLLDNVTLGDPSIAPARAEAAARAARLDRLLERMGAQGLDAPVREAGRNLSAGEAQLVTLARVLARDPRVVLLDEATARVDSLTEALLDEAMAELMRDRTVVVVAHRLSTVRAADRILVIAGGGIHEAGTHDELLAAGGLYARMWRQRAASGEA